MGCCFSDGSDGEGGGIGRLLKVARSETQPIDVTTPCATEVVIRYPAKVSVNLSSGDKKRTVEVSWLDEDDKQKFDDSLANMFSTRYLPRNQLSEAGWKTLEDYDKTAVIDRPGTYYLVTRSSSVVSDKNVTVKGTILKSEVFL
ncbi:hypothetical protein DIPPA_20168 [Diplonema papillatum]|nr:hypothetical protein DIPPA_20168 [Diplonema papillatum]